MYSLNHIISNTKYVLRVIKRKPIFFLRLLKSYCKVMSCADNFLPLRFADVAVTYNCNMRCTHCSSTLLKQPDKQELSVHDYEHIFNDLAKAGCLVINFTGGDPFVRSDFFEIIKVMNTSRFLVAIQTNGYAVTYDKLLELKKNGVDSINVSIDSYNSSEHDRFRNKNNAFSRAVNTIKMASEIGFNIGISYCLTHQNIHSSERAKLSEMAKDMSAMLNYNLAVPIGFWRGNTEASLTTEDRKFLIMLLEAEPHTKTDFETNFKEKGCGAIKEKIYMTAYGDIMPCPFIQVSFGNILESNIDEIRRRAFALDVFKSYSDVCLAAENKDFISSTLCYDKEYDGIFPIYYTKAFTKRMGKISEHVEFMQRPCPICFSKDYSIVSTGIDYEYEMYSKPVTLVKCSNCSVCYLNPAPSEQDLHLFYPTNYKPHRMNRVKSFNLILWVRKILDLKKARCLSKYLTSNNPIILDIGCGDGRYLYILKEAFPNANLLGIDFSEDATSNYSNAFNVITGDYLNAKMEKEHYDVIILNQVIEHVVSPGDLLKKIYSELKVGGIVNIETPSLEGVDFSLFKSKYWGGYHYPRHLTLFTETTLRNFLNQNGFEVLGVKYMYSPVFWVFSLHHWWKSTIGKGANFFSDSNPFVLALATIIDIFQLILRGKTSNMQIIARKISN